MSDVRVVVSPADPACIHIEGISCGSYLTVTEALDFVKKVLEAVEEAKAQNTAHGFYPDRKRVRWWRH